MTQESLFTYMSIAGTAQSVVWDEPASKVHNIPIKHTLPCLQMYLSNIEPTSSTMPTMYSNGNHESEGPGLPDSAGLGDPESPVPDAGRCSEDLKLGC